MGELIAFRPKREADKEWPVRTDYHNMKPGDKFTDPEDGLHYRVAGRLVGGFNRATGRLELHRKD